MPWKDPRKKKPEPEPEEEPEEEEEEEQLETTVVTKEDFNPPADAEVSEELDPAEKLYEDLMSKPMAELRDLADKLEVERRKTREDSVYAIMAAMEEQDPEDTDLLEHCVKCGDVVTALITHICPDRYDVLLKLNMKELRPIGDAVGATRRKVRESYIEEIIKAEEATMTPVEPKETDAALLDEQREAYREIEGDVKDVLIPERRKKSKTPGKKAPAENYVFRVRSISVWECPDCDHRVVGSEQLEAIDGTRTGMAGNCNCKPEKAEWRFVLTHELQRKLPGEGWKVYGQ